MRAINLTPLFRIVEVEAEAVEQPGFAARR
jgi:hypothetical protein